GDDARADEEALADRGPQVDGQERLAPEVADRGEARPEGGLGVLDGREGALEGRILEPVDLVVAIGARTNMGMAVDQARKDPGFGQVDDVGPVRDADLPRGTHALDPLTLDQDRLVPAEGVARAVEQAAGLDDGERRRLGWSVGPDQSGSAFKNQGDDERKG